MLQDALRDKCLTSLCNYNVTLEEMRNVSDIIVGLLEAPPELHSKLVAACPTIGGTGEELVTYNEACFDGLKALWARKWTTRQERGLKEQQDVLVEDNEEQQLPKHEQDKLLRFAAGETRAARMPARKSSGP